LVLGGDVDLHPDGTALVNSLTDPTRAYQVTGSPATCACKDYDHAPEHLCCHRLAVGFTRKVQELLPTPAPEPTPVAPLGGAAAMADPRPRPRRRGARAPPRHKGGGRSAGGGGGGPAARGPPPAAAAAPPPHPPPP